MINVGNILFPLVIWGISLYVLYWIIRIAVKHGMQDANKS
ncbi:hypothetical protein JOD17_000832 [Geomicrobium sediminis]|uniref:Uncharacterized protein n=1 Tax=Geomicrobium sediminis TaxID=1347788 RepID=A0ABS2P8L2_9BACL|nr:hypothetical protein [Geomicrobium sediminis]